jgi:hypothetical protein
MSVTSPLRMKTAKLTVPVNPCNKQALRYRGPGKKQGKAHAGSRLGRKHMPVPEDFCGDGLQRNTRPPDCTVYWQRYAPNCLEFK